MEGYLSWWNICTWGGESLALKWLNPHNRTMTSPAVISVISCIDSDFENAYMQIADGERNSRLTNTVYIW